MAKDRVHIDVETYCEESLPAVGPSHYTRHETAEILMGQWSLNDVPQEQWLPAEGEPLPDDLKEALLDPHVEKWAWNAPFEIGCFRNILGLDTPVSSWKDTMVLALSCGLPGKLEKAGPVLDLGEDKTKAAYGKRLMTKFSMPRKPTRKLPDTRVYWHQDFPEWLKYREYNRQDEVSERAVWHRLKSFMLPDHEWDLWQLDQEINERGIPINMRMVRNAIMIYERSCEEKFAQMTEITGLDNPNSGAQLLPWLKSQGYVFDDLKKGHVVRALEMIEEKRKEEKRNDPDPEPTPYEKVLLLRAETSRTSPTKYYALERSVDIEPGSDFGVLRYGFQFAGASRTWRWAGRIFQPHNLPKPTKYLEKKIASHALAVEHLDFESFNLIYHKPMDVLASCLRPAAQAPDGYVFIDADLNAIENRVLGWLSHCPKILRVFQLKRDPYIDFATYLFGGAYDDLMAEYKAGDSYKRTISKPGVLGCGYMLGPGAEFYDRKTGEKDATGLLGYAWNMGVKEFTLEQSKLSVETFRREFEEVKTYWYAVEKAFKKCIRTGKPVEHEYLRFDRKGPFARMILPSGRSLHYCRPRIEDTVMPWGETRPSITYEEQDKNKQWTRGSTHPGKVTENADQAIARDLLAHGMMLAKKRYNLDIRIHVHDQIVGLVKEDQAEKQRKQLLECMEEPVHWAPGLPLGAACHISKVFLKD